MALLVRGKKVAIQKLKKQEKKETSFYVDVSQDEFLGIVKHVGAEASADIKIGQRVYFGNVYHPIKIDGLDVLIMDDTNVLAILE